MAERSQQPGLVDLGPVPLDGLETVPDPFTAADERSAGEPVERPSDDDLFGHLEQEEPSIPEGGVEGDMLAAEAAWAAVEDRDWAGASTLFAALESNAHRQGLAPGVHDETAFDVVPIAPDASRAYFVIVDQGPGRWVMLDGPFDDFDAAVVPLHNAAKRFRTRHADAPDARSWRYVVIAVPAALAWMLRESPRSTPSGALEH